MLDCGLDLSPMLSFLPLQGVEGRARGDPVERGGVEGELREVGGALLVDSQPEVRPPQEGLVNFADLDAILVSNYTCMLGLPYVTEGTGFRGKVYATEPTLLLGRIFMEEMVEYLARAPRHTTAAGWKARARQLPPPLCDLPDVGGLRNLYSRETMEASLARVQLVGCGERISVFGLLQVHLLHLLHLLFPCTCLPAPLTRFAPCPLATVSAPVTG